MENSQNQKSPRGQEDDASLNCAAGHASARSEDQTTPDSMQNDGFNPMSLLWAHQLRREHVVLVTRLDNLEGAVNNLAGQVRADDTRQALEHLDKVDNEIKGLDARLKAIDARVSGIENAMVTKADKQGIEERIDALGGSLERRYVQHQEDLHRIEREATGRLDLGEDLFRSLVQCAEKTRITMNGLGNRLLDTEAKLSNMEREHDIGLKAPVLSDEHVRQIATSAVANALRSRRYHGNAFQRTTIPPSQAAETPTVSRLPRSPFSFTVVQSIECDNPVLPASECQDNCRKRSISTMDIDSSPQVEEHHQFGGSLEIDTMLPPASPFPFTTSPPRKELPVVQQCLSPGNETADTQENSSVIRGQESPGVASITESMKESLHLQQEGQEGQESVKQSSSRRSDKSTQRRRKKRKREIPIVWDDDEYLPS